MRRSLLTLIAAALFVAAIPASASPAIFKKAKEDKKEGVVSCDSCHSAKPYKKDALTPLGKTFKK